MSRQARAGFDGGKPGTWPNGEPQSIRDAYDQLLAEQAQAPNAGQR